MSDTQAAEAPQEFSLDDWLGRAASTAAFALMRDANTIADLFTEDDVLGESFAKFVRTAGDVPGESLYRWSAARGLHPLPADGYARVAPDVRLFFDSFVAVAKALVPVLDPPKAHQNVVFPGRPHVDPEDTIFRGYGARDERAHARVADGVPITTEGLWIVPAAPAPAAAAAPQPGAPSFQPMTIGADALTRLERGNPPTMQEFTAMTPEERRPYSALFGLPGIEAVMNEQPDSAPEAEGLEMRDVAGEVENAVKGEPGQVRVSGQVAIGKTKPKAK